MLNQPESIVGHSHSLSLDSPPIVEVAVSVQFDPPKGFNLGLLGAFWATRKNTLPNIRTIPAIPTTNEYFGADRPWFPPSLQLALTNDPDCRLQMTSDDDQWMCQLQRNRLVVNWRKRGGDYPRFNKTWDYFEDLWGGWINFLTQEKIAKPVPQLWELVYVNRIPKGNLWQSPKDWPGIFPGLWGGEIATLPGANLGGFHGQWVWDSTQPPARLYIEPKPGRSLEEPGQDVLLLSLTARGMIDADPIKQGIEFGHDWIITAFDKISSEAAKKEWKQNDNIH